MITPVHLLRTALVIALVVVVAIPGLALAWPERVVRLVTPTAAGGGSDAVARTLAEALGKRWNRAVVVDNRPGADGLIAIEAFLNARDGHTLLFSFSGVATVNMLLHDKLPYDPMRDLLPISPAVRDFVGVVAAPSAHIESLRDLVTVARAKPGALNYTTVPSGPYLAFLALQKRAGIELSFIAYRNPLGALPDLVEGRIQIAVLPLSPILGHVKAGSLKLLAVTNHQRAPAVPDVPTVAEAGYPDAAFDGILGLFAPKDMPSERRERLAREVRSGVEEPEVAERLRKLGYVPYATSPTDFAIWLEDQRVKWAALARAYGARPAR